MDKNIKPNTDGGPSDKEPGHDRNAVSEAQWANSLRTMYDKVVEEPLPDSFKDLLAQFDDPSTGSKKGDGGTR